MGTVYWEMGEFEEASRYLKETLRLNPKATGKQFSNSVILRYASIEMQRPFHC